MEVDEQEERQIDDNVIAPPNELINASDSNASDS